MNYKDDLLRFLFIFIVYVGYPEIPFINFDQVILPKYEANVKMGKDSNR